MKGNALKKGVLLPKQRPRPRLRQMRGETLSKAIVINGSKKGLAQEAVPADSNMTNRKREPAAGPDLPNKKGKAEVDPTAQELVVLRKGAKALQARIIDLHALIFAKVIVKKETNVTFGILQSAFIIRREIAQQVTNVLSFILKTHFPLPLNRKPRQKLNLNPRMKAVALPWCMVLQHLRRRSV